MVQTKKTIPKSMTDLYQAWSDASGGIDFNPIQKNKNATFIVLYEVKLKTAINKMHQVKTIEDYVDKRMPSLRVRAKLSIQFHPFWWTDKTLYGTATVTEKGLSVFKRLVQSGIVSRFEISLMPRQARPKHKYEMPTLSGGVKKIKPSTAETIYGIIDHGCPFAHPGLKTTKGTSRLLNVWYQDGNSNYLKKESPVSWGFGGAANADDFDNLLKTHTELVDSQIYAKFNFPELERSASHGAHMLGLLLAAQNSSSLTWANRRPVVPSMSSDKLPEQPDVVFVQLPDVYLDNLTRCAVAPYRMSAMRYILACAGDATKNIYVPLSSEDYVGSHDGTTLFECALDAMVAFAAQVKKVKLQIFIAAGNNLRMHTHSGVKTINSGAPAVFQVRLLPDNELPTYIEIWLNDPIQASDMLCLSIKPLNAANNIAELKATKIGDRTATFTHIAGDTKKIYSGLVSMNLQNQHVLLLRLPPTLSWDSAIATLPSSDWDIQLSVVGEMKEIAAHAYIARSFSGLGGDNRSHQSQFIVARNTTQNTDTLKQAEDLLDEYPTYGEGSANGMAHGAKVSVIGGYRISDGKRAHYSAAGPSRGAGNISTYSVTAAAPSDESPSLSGIRSWGNRNAGTVRLNGTSVAAPLATRFVVDGNSLVFVTLPSDPTDVIDRSKSDPQIPVVSLR